MHQKNKIAYQVMLIAITKFIHIFFVVISSQLKNKNKHTHRNNTKNNNAYNY